MGEERAALVSAYRRGRGYCIISSVEAGPYFPAPPVFTVDESDGNDVLGAAVRVAAEAARVYEGPRDRFGLVSDRQLTRDWGREVLESVGVKDFQSLDRGAKLVSIEWFPGELTMKPMRRYRGAWSRQPVDDDLPEMRVVRLSTSCTDAEIGAALRAASSGPTRTG